MELGQKNAARFDDLRHATMIYETECSSTNVCQQVPSLPFRRVSTNSIQLHAESRSSDIFIYAEVTAALGQITGLTGTKSSIMMVCFKFVVVLLVAAVVFIRRRRESTSTTYLLFHSIDVSCSRTPKNIKKSSQTLYEDGAIGFIAFILRAAAVFLQYERLASDGQARVCNIEILAVFCSAMHWFLRYFSIKGNNSADDATCALGGATILLDCTAATMIAFSSTPLLTPLNDAFEPTARLLTAW